MKEFPSVPREIDEKQRQKDWSLIFHWRQKFKKEFGRIEKLPIVRSAAEWIISEVKANPNKKISLLDYGAGPRLLKEKIASIADKIEYVSYDIDRSTEQDYYNSDDIKRTFDLVVCLEVIEHLDAGAKIDLVRDMTRLTAPGGKIILTTPNAEHPTVFWRDFSHVAPIHHLDLAGLLARFGLKNIKIYRLAKMTLKKRFLLLFYAPLLKLLHCDFAQSIMSVAEKEQNDE